MCVAIAALGMTAAQTAMVGATVASAAVSARAAQNQATLARGVARNNAAIADMQSADALKRGEDNATRALRQGRMVAASQRAAFSARGLDISEGTPADIIDQTNFFSQSDAETARSNGRKEAWAAQVARGNSLAQASAARPGEAFGTTLLASAPAVASRWYEGRKA